MSIQQAVQILRELHELESNGVQLPYSPQFILRQEIHGHVVDLETGEIILNGADQRYGLTELGQNLSGAF